MGTTRWITSTPQTLRKQLSVAISKGKPAEEANDVAAYFKIGVRLINLLPKNKERDTVCCVASTASISPISHLKRCSKLLPQYSPVVRRRQEWILSRQSHNSVSSSTCSCNIMLTHNWQLLVTCHLSLSPNNTIKSSLQDKIATLCILLSHSKPCEKNTKQIIQMQQ